MSNTQLLNRSDPDKVLFTFTNADGTQLSNGQCIEWDTTNTLGVSCEITDAHRTPLVCGVVVETVDTGAVGRAQRYGLHEAVLTTTTVTAGNAVCADTSGKCVQFTASTTSVVLATANEMHSVIGIVAEAPTAATSAKVHLRMG